MKMIIITLLLLSFLLIMCPVTGAFWFPSLPHHQHQHQHQRVIIKFEEEINGKTRVTISEPEGSGITVAGADENDNNSYEKEGTGDEVAVNRERKCQEKLLDTIKSVGEKATEVVGKFAEPKEKISEKLPDTIKSVGKKATQVVGKAGSTVANAIGMVTFNDKIKGVLKDSVVKIEDWDAIDSRKRIGEDIEQNASAKIEPGVEELKETMESVTETNVNELLTRSKNAIGEVSWMVSLEKARPVISFCYLLGFSTAYGIGVWVTLFSRFFLGKCLPKQQFAMVLNKMNLVYFRLMACCLGASLFGYLVTQGRGVFSTKMKTFQGFNLVSGFLMVLINLLFLVPQATKLIVEGVKEKSTLTESVALEKLKKMNTYSSMLNASTMVMLTWHVAYIGQVLQV